jgi:hypothetical protein
MRQGVKIEHQNSLPVAPSEHDPEKAAPHLMRGEYRFSAEIMLKQKSWSKMAIGRKAILL